jgi:hypothetical protein
VAYLAAGDNGLQIVDVSNPASPVLRSSLALPAFEYANGVAVAGGTAYVSGSNNQLYAVDVRTPAQPTLLDSRTIPGFPTNVRSANNLVLVAAQDGGLQIFRARGPLQHPLYLPVVAR